MSPIQTTLDIIMCILWGATYTLAFISTLKFRCPAISPISQMIIAPFEISVLMKYIAETDFFVGYGFYAYCYWSVIDVTSLAVALKIGKYPGKYIYKIVIGAVIMTAIMAYLVTVKGYMFFFSYFNTFVGEVVWLIHITKKDYPATPLNLALFITKLLADVIAIPVYFGYGTWISSVICIGLPMLDLCFIAVYLERSSQLKYIRRK